ncbi:MAG: hypothetical protein ACRDQJ_00905 [Pseudonocardiaceae bacterium]
MLILALTAVVSVLTLATLTACALAYLGHRFGRRIDAYGPWQLGRELAMLAGERVRHG